MTQPIANHQSPTTSHQSLITSHQIRTARVVTAFKKLMSNNFSAANRRGGFTLIEILAVVTILAIVAVLAVTRTGRLVGDSRRQVAEHDLCVLREAFVDSESGLVRDLQGLPGFTVGTLCAANLFVATNFTAVSRAGEYFRTEFRFDADAQKGWRGPYAKAATAAWPRPGATRFEGDPTFEERGFWPPVAGLRLPPAVLARENGASPYGVPGETVAIDPWGNPYVLQIPPAQAFPGANTNLSDRLRFEYARLVSAGPDGRLDTPCYAINFTNQWFTSWTEATRRLSRQAGRIGEDVSARGDDLVLFLSRADVDEGADAEIRGR